MTTEYKAQLAPVESDGLTIESEIQRSWVVSDSHHPILEAHVKGNLLELDMAGQAFRVSHLQADALLKALSAWKRTWSE